MLLKRKAEYAKEPKECFFLEALPDLTVVQNMPSPRPLNTHLPYRWLPIQHIQNGGKIVHLLRNPKDVCVSMYHHFKTTMSFGKLRDFGTFFDKLFLNPKGKRERKGKEGREQIYKILIPMQDIHQIFLAAFIQSCLNLY